MLTKSEFVKKHNLTEEEYYSRKTANNTVPFSNCAFTSCYNCPFNKQKRTEYVINCKKNIEQYFKLQKNLTILKQYQSIPPCSSHIN